MKIIFVLVILTVAVVLGAPGAAAADRDCPDYCADGVLYTRGTYDARTSTCDYAYRVGCDRGCDARGTTCAAAPIATVATAERSCPDYCSDQMAYSRGTWNSRTSTCEYAYRSACDSGCDARGTTCAAGPAATGTSEVRRSCPDTCSGGVHSFNGDYSTILQQCTYMTRTCVNGCSGTTCARDPAGCADYCRDGVRHFNGSWNEWAQQCDYQYREECTSGCDARGTTCTGTVTGQVTSEAERFITCPSDASCITRQGGAERWPGGAKMVSNSPCGKGSDGTYQYCIQSAAQVTTLPATAGPERFITCPSDCSCIPRQGAVDRWQGAVSMCSSSPCGRASDGTSLYCIRPTDQKAAGIRQQYTGASGAVIAVNPAFDGEQLVFVVSRERQAMLLGVIPVRMTVNTRLNGTDLAVIREERPWWGFLVTGDATSAPAPVTPTPAPTPPPVSGTSTCLNASWNGKCYDSAYDLDKDCHMTKDASLSVCGNQIKSGSGEITYQEWIAIYPWDCDDKDPAVWACETLPAAGVCKNESFNAKCYHSPLDMDFDCHMNNVTGFAYCGYEVKDKYGEAAYTEWVATYPWDCKDVDPTILVCTVG